MTAPKGFLLRPALPSDGPALADVWVEAWTATLPAIDFEARRDWFAEHRLELAAAGARTIVAIRPDGACAGFAIVDQAEHELHQLCVARAAQGSGAATLLLAEARRLSPAGLSLSVNADNPRAIRFYEREGFKRREAGHNERSGLPIWRYEWVG